MNNPLQFVQMMRNPQVMQMVNNPQFQQQFQQTMRNVNPSQILDSIQNNPQAMNIPMVKNVMEMRKNNDTEGLTGLAENVFGEKGKNYGEFEKEAKQFLGFN